MWNFSDYLLRRSSEASSSMEEKPRLLVLYASQTGNALDAAERIGREAERRGCPALVLSMDDYNAVRTPPTISSSFFLFKVQFLGWLWIRMWGLVITPLYIFISDNLILT